MRRMIRVYYVHADPRGGFHSSVHSTPVADLAQFWLRMSAMGHRRDEILVIATEDVDTSGENAAADFYARYGTAGEF